MKPGDRVEWYGRSGLVMPDECDWGDCRYDVCVTVRFSVNDSVENVDADSLVVIDATGT